MSDAQLDEMIRAKRKIGDKMIFWDKIYGIIFSEFSPTEWLLFFVFFALSCGMHESAHLLLAKKYNCYRASDFCFWRKPYLLVVYSTCNETIKQNMIITGSGLLGGLLILPFTMLYFPLSIVMIFFLMEIVASEIDLTNLFLLWQWGKQNGYERPCWHAPRGYWIAGRNYQEIYEADDFPLDHPPYKLPWET